MQPNNFRTSTTQTARSLFLVVLIDVEVAKLIRGLAGSNDTKKISKLLFLQVLLGQVLQISLGEWSFGLNMDLGLLARDGDFVAKISTFAIHLYSLLQELLQLCSGDDGIISWLLTINGELQQLLLAFASRLLLSTLNNHGGRNVWWMNADLE